jgi:hypothetical protein
MEIVKAVIKLRHSLDGISCVPQACNLPILLRLVRFLFISRPGFLSELHNISKPVRPNILLDLLSTCLTAHAQSVTRDLSVRSPRRAIASQQIKQIVGESASGSEATGTNDQVHRVKTAAGSLP